MHTFHTCCDFAWYDLYLENESNKSSPRKVLLVMSSRENRNLSGKWSLSIKHSTWIDRTNKSVENNMESGLGGFGYMPWMQERVKLFHESESARCLVKCLRIRLWQSLRNFLRIKWGVQCGLEDLQAGFIGSHNAKKSLSLLKHLNVK